MVKLDESLLEIRKMKAEDYPDMYALWKKTPGTHLREFDDSFEEVSRVIKFNPGFCFIAQRDGQLVGTILGTTDGRRGRIYHLSVAKEVQGNGLGQKLVNLVIKRLKEVGIKKVVVNVMASNSTGEAFLKKMKFSKRSDIETYDKII